MMYYCCFGCSINSEEEIIEASSNVEALEYACQKALENFSNYDEGLRGIQSFDEFVEKNTDFYENDKEELLKAWNEYVENDIYYYVETFDFEKYTHINTFEAQNGEVYDV